ncbi:unnamed protein product [Caenorhabditis bovis]|uniref:C2H2-type domain-containing protein n=1 Tax=Caenorhabditis bovis TaxID=2654633 RepID=A0A8S1F244_9PELO|nr:unnamed protein product [Caenorhabditis bovis]
MSSPIAGLDNCPNWELIDQISVPLLETGIATLPILQAALPTMLTINANDEKVTQRYPKIIRICQLQIQHLLRSQKELMHRLELMKHQTRKCQHTQDDGVKYKCDDCGKVFVSKDYLLSHFERRHKQGSGSSFVFFFILIYPKQIDVPQVVATRSDDGIISKSVLIGYSNADRSTIFSAFIFDNTAVLILSSYGYLNRRIYCRFFDGNHSEISQQSTVVFPEFTVKCAANNSAKFVAISVNKKDKIENLTKLEIRKHMSDSHEFSVCLAPIFGNSPKLLLFIEFVEYYRIQGASHFLVYVYESNEYMEKALKIYEQMRLIDIIRIGNETKCLKRHRCRHEMQLQDCVYRSRRLSKWVATVDLDERLMNVEQSKPISQLLRSQNNDYIAELRFRCQWTLRYSELSKDSEITQNNFKNFLPMLKWHNTSHIAPQNHTTKSIIRPENVDSMGVHGVQKFSKSYHVQLIDPKIAVVRHYRYTEGWSYFLREAESFGPFSNFSLISEVCPGALVIWCNCVKIYDYSVPNLALNPSTRLVDLGVVQSSFLHAFTQNFPNPAPNSTVALVPKAMLTAQRFAIAASRRFELSKRQNRLTRNQPSGSNPRINRSAAERLLQLLSQAALPNVKADDSWKEKARISYERMKASNGAYLALDAPQITEKFEKNPNMSFEEYYAIFKEYFDELGRKQQLMNDPNSEEGQRLIQQLINRNRIARQYDDAIEHHPETMIPVTMLYVNATINGHPVKAFIDSGAQVSIMSLACAQRCNLTDVIDRRFQTLCHGIGGVNRAYGKIHLCDVKIENAHFSCPFTVGKDPKMDLLIGLDVLRKHNCCINLAKNCLEFPNGTSTPFLQSNEIEAFLAEIIGNSTDNGEPMDQSGPSN